MKEMNILYSKKEKAMYYSKFSGRTSGNNHTEVVTCLNIDWLAMTVQDQIRLHIPE